MRLPDPVYFALVGAAVTLWLVCSVWWVAARLTERKWRKRRQQRPGYLPIYNEQQDPRELVGR